MTHGCWDGGGDDGGCGISHGGDDGGCGTLHDGGGVVIVTDVVELPRTSAETMLLRFAAKSTTVGTRSQHLRIPAMVAKMPVG